jgi:hypothetical protein
MHLQAAPEPGGIAGLVVARWLARLEHDDDLIWLSAPEVRFR